MSNKLIRLLPYQIASLILLIIGLLPIGIGILSERGNMSTVIGTSYQPIIDTIGNIFGNSADNQIEKIIFFAIMIAIGGGVSAYGVLKTK